MPEPLALAALSQEAAPPWRRFVADCIHPRVHARLRRALTSTLDTRPDAPRIVVTVAGAPASGKSTLLHVARRTFIATGAIHRVHMIDGGSFFAGVHGARAVWVTCSALAERLELMSEGAQHIELRTCGPVVSPKPFFFEQVGTLDVLTWVAEKGVTHV